MTKLSQDEACETHETIESSSIGVSKDCRRDGNTHDYGRDPAQTEPNDSHMSNTVALNNRSQQCNNKADSSEKQKYGNEGPRELVVVKVNPDAEPSENVKGESHVEDKFGSMWDKSFCIKDFAIAKDDTNQNRQENRDAFIKEFNVLPGFFAVNGILIHYFVR